MIHFISLYVHILNKSLGAFERLRTSLTLFQEDKGRKKKKSEIQPKIFREVFKEKCFCNKICFIKPLSSL